MLFYTQIHLWRRPVNTMKKFLIEKGDVVLTLHVSVKWMFSRFSKVNTISPIIASINHYEKKFTIINFSKKSKHDNAVSQLKYSIRQ